MSDISRDQDLELIKSASQNGSLIKEKDINVIDSESVIKVDDVDLLSDEKGNF